MKILKEIHANEDGHNEMWFELSKGYNFKISHKDKKREELVKCAQSIYEDIKEK